MCDTFVVVSEDRVLFGKNSDRDPNEAQVLSWVPAQTWTPGSTLRCTWIDVPQVARTNAIVVSRPFWMWGAEMGANEHGVVIGNEAIFTREPLRSEGLTGMDLVRLALERAATASDAKDLICELIARHGQGGRCGYDKPAFSYHNSFLVADVAGAWVVEAADRKVATRRIDAGVYAISNGITLPELSSHEDRIRPRVAMASLRRERVKCLAQAATSVRDAMDVLRDHGDAEAGPRYRRLNGAMSAPCMHAGGWLAASQTVGSFVADLRESDCRFWATGTAAPCLSVFRPVSVQQPRDVGTPTGVQDESLWWRFESVHGRCWRPIRKPYPGTWPIGSGCRRKCSGRTKPPAGRPLTAGCTNGSNGCPVSAWPIPGHAGCADTGSAWPGRHRVPSRLPWRPA